MPQLPNGYSYMPEFLTNDEQHALLHELALLSFTNDSFRGQTLKRSYAQFGYAYVSTGRKLQPATPFPDFLIGLIEKARQHTAPSAVFNQCIITHYPKTAGIGWHTDADRFGECIIAISLAGTARLQFRPNGTITPTHEVITTPGSLYTMRGPARWEYQHQVIPVTADRYSITCRQVMNTTPRNPDVIAP